MTDKFINVYAIHVEFDIETLDRCLINS